MIACDHLLTEEGNPHAHDCNSGRGRHSRLRHGGQRASTVRDFKQMAALSGGKSGFLDGSREMIDMAVMAMLSALKGRDGVQAYMRKTKLSPNAQDFGSLLLSGPK